MIVATLILTLLTFPSSFRYQKILSVDFHASVNAEINAQNNNTDFGRARLGVEGKLLKHFQYKVSGDFASTHPWKDVFLDLNQIHDAQMKIGKFKLPFCMDELTSNRDLDFVDRTRTARDLAPARDIGAMLHGLL